MQRKTLSSSSESLNLLRFAEIIKSGRYFRKISLSLLKEMLRQGEYVTLNTEEYLIRENHSKPPELIVLLEGSLALTSQNHFIMRLNKPGDVVGEMSVISSSPNPYTDVIAEKISQVVIFPHHLFKVSENDTTVSIAYYMFSQILVEKLRYITAHSMLQKNGRTNEEKNPQIGILDPDKRCCKKIKSALEIVWKKATLIELESYHEFLENPLENNFDLIILDPEITTDDTSKTDSIRNLIEICSSLLVPILVISQYCKKEENRQFLAELGVEDFLIKPFSTFDLQHRLTKFRKDHYRRKELEQVEIAADTDRLTGLANRRRMDEFLEAMVTLFKLEKKSFSLIIADVDHFKMFNDTHGHQLGDFVLASVASIFKNRIRRGDMAARFGGDEFVVILPNCAKINAVKVANKLRLEIASEQTPFQQETLENFTCSFGVATFPEDADTMELLLKKADDCLYEGKASGRNKVVATEFL